MQYSLDEICLLPSSAPTSIQSRSEVNPFTENGTLPIFVAPMTSVLHIENFQTFKESTVIPILPRGFQVKTHDWKAYSLKEIETCYLKHLLSNEDHILIDIANGHQERIYSLVKLIKQEYPSITIMIGNIAHPKLLYDCCNAGVDYVRVGIGGGSVCSTSVQTGIHTSHHWFIEEAKKHPLFSSPNRTKLIADGGINTIDKAIKCLALGYDYVMMGKCFAQCEEAWGELKVEFEEVKSNYQKDESELPMVTYTPYRKYYGMASLQGQMDISEGVKKNSEGIESWVPVTHSLSQFTNQFESALRSAMSYTGARTLKEFQTRTKYDIQSIHEFKSYYK